jgi:RNase P/RNase MRP subunit p30
MTDTIADSTLFLNHKLKEEVVLRAQIKIQVEKTEKLGERRAITIQNMVNAQRKSRKRAVRKFRAKQFWLLKQWQDSQIQTRELENQRLDLISHVDFLRRLFGLGDDEIELLDITEAGFKQPEVIQTDEKLAEWAWI